jgi:hypothetical protein
MYQALVGANNKGINKHFLYLQRPHDLAWRQIHKLIAISNMDKPCKKGMDKVL